MLQLRVLQGGQLIIGENVFINTNVCITARKKIFIGDNTKIANNVVIIDHDHDYRNDLSNYICQEIIIGKNCWIGANTVILRGTVIGDNSVISAGSVVRGVFPENSLIYKHNGLAISRLIK